MAAALIAAVAAGGCARGGRAAAPPMAGPVLAASPTVPAAALAAAGEHAFDAPIRVLAASTSPRPVPPLGGGAVGLVRNACEEDAALRLEGAGVLWLSDDAALAGCLPGTETARAVRHAWTAGAMAAGSGDGAEALGRAVAPRIGSRLLLDSPSSPESPPGLALLGDAVVVSDLLDGDRLAAALDAMARDRRVRRVVGLGPGAAVVVDPRRGWMQARGDGPVVVLEREGARLDAKRRRYREVRLHWISPGDQLGWDSGLMQFVERKVRSEGGRARADEPLADAFAPDALGTLVMRLAEAGRGASFSADAGTHTLVLSADGRTTFFRSLDGGDEAREHTVWSALLSLEPKEPR